RETSKVERVGGELSGQLEGRIRNDALDLGGQRLQEEIAAWEASLIAVVVQVGGGHLMPGRGKGGGGPAPAVRRLPPEMGDSLGAQQCFDRAGWRLVAIMAPFGVGVLEPAER